MARIRRVGRYATFTPPTFLEGVAQVADCWSSVSSVTPPRIVYYTKKAPATNGFGFRGSSEKAINASLSGDVRRVGKDMFVCIHRYGSQFSGAKKVGLGE